MLNRLLMSGCLAALLGIAPGHTMADSDFNKAVGAAAAAAGIAALIHHKKNHQSGNHYDDENREFEYERGFNDGVHHATYDNYRDSEDYTHGYNAGIKERENRLEHSRHQEWDDNRHHAPAHAQRACSEAAERLWSLRPGSAVPEGSTEMADDRFRIDIRAGYHDAVCTVSADGEIEGISEV